jgi:hypothetical protein
MSITLSDTLNYRGALELTGISSKTPFFNAIAGRAMRSPSFKYSMAQPWTLAAASQPAITENASIVAGIPTTTTRGEDTNTAQIWKYDVAVSFKKQSEYGLMSGINTNQENPVVDELTFQKTAQLKQLALDLEYTFFNGTYQPDTNTGTAAKTRGIIAGTTTNTVDANSTVLDRDKMDELLRKMSASGAEFSDPAIFVNAFQKQKLSRIYEYVPMSRNEGGSNIQLIETDFGIFKVIYAPQIVTSTLLIADLSMCAPVYVPVMFNADTQMIRDSMEGVDVLWVPTALTAASVGGFWYAQIGLSYGAEENHGVITELSIA